MVLAGRGEIPWSGVDCTDAVRLAEWDPPPFMGPSPPSLKRRGIQLKELSPAQNGMESGKNRRNLARRRGYAVKATAFVHVELLQVVWLSSFASPPVIQF